MKHWRDWLFAFRDEAGCVVLAEERFRFLVDDLPSPDSQCPSLALMVGKSEKQAYLAAEYLEYKTNAVGMAQVHLANPRETHPTLILDVSTSEMYNGHRPERRPILQRRMVASWLSNSASHELESVVDAVFQQLIYHFVDVVCLFLDDFPTSNAAFEQLGRWTGPRPKSNDDCKPNLLLITSERPKKPYFKSPAFSNVRYILIQRKTSSQRKIAISRAINYEICRVRRIRKACHLLFSATHLDGMMRYAMHALSQSAPAPLDLCHFAYSSIIEPTLLECTETFLCICQDASINVDVITKYLASAFVLLSRPPRMHYFESRVVFNTLFESICRKVAIQFALPSSWCRVLLAEYCVLNDLLSKSQVSATTLHRSSIASLNVDWSRMHTSRLCLWCIARRPEHPLHCGHSICDNCSIAFGDSIPADYTFLIHNCILCDHREDLRIRLKPPTAGPRLLVLDGGGVRGAFTLLALKALEDSRELPYPLRDDFDLVVGTSSGGLIALMLMLGRSVSKCISTFDSMVLRVFRKKPKNHWILKALVSLQTFLFDSVYGAANIEACVKEAYGTGRLFGERLESQNLSSLKCAVTTMTVKDSKLCLLTNYNGPLHREGYQFFRPTRMGDEVSIHTAARATSAAPSYFPATYIPSFGFVQDGGAGKHNNPVEPAEWESRAIWQAPPDLVLSVGTGYAVGEKDAPSVPHKLGFHERFFPRLLRLFAELLDSETHWKDHVKQIDESRKDAYIRVNMALQSATELDDVSRLPEIKSWSERFLRSFDFCKANRALFSASFFLVLDDVPREHEDSLVCAAAIRCRSPNPPALLRRIAREYPHAYFALDENVYLGPITDAQICIACSTYCKNVCFNVEKETQMINVYLHFDRVCRKPISGFPQSASDLSRKQMLDAVFGRADHQTSMKAMLGHCRCSSTLKRKSGNQRAGTKRHCLRKG